MKDPLRRIAATPKMTSTREELTLTGSQGRPPLFLSVADPLSRCCGHLSPFPAGWPRIVVGCLDVLSDGSRASCARRGRVQCGERLDDRGSLVIKFFQARRSAQLSPSEDVGRLPLGHDARMISQPPGVRQFTRAGNIRQSLPSRLTASWYVPLGTARRSSVARIVVTKSRISPAAWADALDLRSESSTWMS